MLKSAFIEEKKFKHSTYSWAGADNPLGPKFLCQQEGLITMVICCMFQNNLFNLWLLYTSFHDLINVYSCRSGTDNPRGQNFDVNRNFLSLWSFATSFKKISLKSDFIQYFFSWFYTCIALEQELTTPWGQNFDANRNFLSLWSFATSLKKSLFEVQFYKKRFMIK